MDNAELYKEVFHPQGIVFRCTDPQFAQLLPAVDAYLASYGLNQSLLSRQMNTQTHTLSLRAADASASDDTLRLVDDVALGLTDELVELSARPGESNRVMTVSKKEILLAMLQPGRATHFEGVACDLQALKDHVGIRQNIVAWSEMLAWRWPDGGPARLNGKYWKRGSPIAGFPLHVAVNDVFINQGNYSLGCYAASKLVMIQGILDYYHRIKNDPVTVGQLESKLQQDGSPLSFTEPGVMWSFESDSTQEDRARPGKLLAIQFGIPSKHFIPGDWSYFLNTDPVTHEKTGYEGSNAVYLGRGKFSDFYNDHNHYYTYKDKLHEVFQWRNRVFNERRDVAKIQPLAAADYARLGNTPEHGGVQLDLRVFPLLFGYQEQPVFLSGDQ